MDLLKTWWWHWKDPRVLKQSLGTAAIVGSILVLVNVGNKLLVRAISLSVSIKVILTYLVPYFVSSFTAVRTQVRLAPGEYAPQDGVYRCDECLQSGRIHEIELESGDNIPECKKFGKETEYVLVSAEG